MGFLLSKQSGEPGNADPPLDEPFLFRLLFLKGKNIRKCIVTVAPPWGEASTLAPLWGEASKGKA